jgi:hypothetical protein
MSLRSELRETRDDLVAEIESLREEVRAMETRKRTAGLEAELSEEVITLKREKVDLEIEAAKKEEEFARERREIEHLTGLYRKQTESEKELATREAELRVREENLGEERKLFEAKMTSVTKNLEERIEYLQNNLVERLMGAVTGAMPTVDLAFGNRAAAGRPKKTA